jgi:hypothetical protein
MKDYKEVELMLNRVGNSVVSKNYHVSKTPFKNSGKNFMTSDVAFIGKLGKSDIFVELSYGTGFCGDYIFGVTFKDFNDTDFYDYSGCCYSEQEITEKIQLVKKAFKSKL